MIEENAVVLRIDQGKTYLEIVRNSPCGICGQTRGCGVSIWGRLFGHRQAEFFASNDIEAQVGDNVVVGVEENALLFGSLLAYGVPLLTLIIGAMLGNWMSPANWGRDMASALGAGAGLLLGMLWLKGRTAMRGHDARYQPVILRPAKSCGGRVCQS